MGEYWSSDLAEQHDKGLISGFLLGVLISCMFIVMAHAIKPDRPRLVGYGCEGAGGPLFANEEDHFPKCKAIEAWPLRLTSVTRHSEAMVHDVVLPRNPYIT